MDGSRENAYPSQSPHVGFDMNRVQPLIVGINLEVLRQLFRTDAENNVFKVMLGNNVATAPQGFGTDIFGTVGLFGNVQGVMSLDAEGELLH